MNSQCDGDRDSYDAMILLTGRFDYHDVRPGLTIFFIFIRGKALGFIMVSYFGMGARCNHPITGFWLPLTEPIYERLLTGSELYWGNLAAHKIKLKTLVPPRGNKIMAICFLGSEYYTQRLNRPFDENGKKIGPYLWPPRSHFWPIFEVKGMISHDFLAQMFP